MLQFAGTFLKPSNIKTTNVFIRMFEAYSSIIWCSTCPTFWSLVTDYNSQTNSPLKWHQTWRMAAKAYIFNGGGSEAMLEDRIIIPINYESPILHLLNL